MRHEYLPKMVLVPPFQGSNSDTIPPYCLYFDAFTFSSFFFQAEDQEALMANSTPDKNRECRNGIRKASLSYTTSV